jgi:hypothetical protein
MMIENDWFHSGAWRANTFNLPEKKAVSYTSRTDMTDMSVSL